MYSTRDSVQSNGTLVKKDDETMKVYKTIVNIILR